MARLFLILIVIAICIITMVMLHGIWASAMRTSSRGIHRAAATIEGHIMGTTGIQKAAYIALIVVLFGAASGWLGGL